MKNPARLLMLAGLGAALVFGAALALGPGFDRAAREPPTPVGLAPHHAKPDRQDGDETGTRGASSNTGWGWAVLPFHVADASGLEPQEGELFQRYLIEALKRRGAAARLEQAPSPKDRSEVHDLWWKQGIRHLIHGSLDRLERDGPKLRLTGQLREQRGLGGTFEPFRDTPIDFEDAIDADAPGARPTFLRRAADDVAHALFPKIEAFVTLGSWFP